MIAKKISERVQWLRRLFSANPADRILDAVCMPITVLPCPECVAHQV